MCVFFFKAKVKNAQKKQGEGLLGILNWRYVAGIKEISEEKLEKRGWSQAQDLACWSFGVNACKCLVLGTIHECGQYGPFLFQLFSYNVCVYIYIYVGITLQYNIFLEKFHFTPLYHHHFCNVGHPKVQSSFNLVYQSFNCLQPHPSVNFS